MHIEPGLISPEKMLLAYAAAAAAGTMTIKLAIDSIRERGPLSLLARSALTTAAVFSFFQVLPHHPVGVSEVHLILGSTLLLVFGTVPAAIGLALGLLLQGLFFAPFDLPLYAANVTTLLVPHAKTMWDIEFPCRAFSTFTHPLQAEALVDAHGRHVPHHPLLLPETLKLDTTMPGPLKSVSLLLNGLMLGGVACTPYAVYAEGIAQIARWCRQRGVQLQVRSRPGQVMLDLLMQHAGLTPAEIEAPMAGPLTSFVAETELCLMYDAATNAAADFLRAGVPILNPVVDVLSRAERMTCSDLIVPREDVSATLDRLDHFIADPQRLQLFRNRQFLRYAALFENARPLRQWLR